MHLKSRIIIYVLFFLGIFSFSINRAKKHYVTGERLWTSKDYLGAAKEFERAFELDPKGKIGARGLFQAASTEYLFLNRYEDAYKKFERYLLLNITSEEAVAAENQMGDLLFLKLERYPQSIGHYERIIKKYPNNPLVPEFLLRQGKARFYLKRFTEAISTYEKIIKDFPTTGAAERAHYEMALTYYTKAENGSAGNQDAQRALDLFLLFIKKYPTSGLKSEAEFGVASCLEEMGQLDAAYKAYETLRSSYPSPKVIEIKMIRLKDRRSQSSPSKK